jgi:hypothetical protein
MGRVLGGDATERLVMLDKAVFRVGVRPQYFSIVPDLRKPNDLGRDRGKRRGSGMEQRRKEDEGRYEGKIPARLRHPGLAATCCCE